MRRPDDVAPVDDAFEEARGRFVRRAGGVFVHRRPWHRMTSRDKHALSWD